MGIYYTSVITLTLLQEKPVSALHRMALTLIPGVLKE